MLAENVIRDKRARRTESRFLQRRGGIEDRGVSFSARRGKYDCRANVEREDISVVVWDTYLWLPESAMRFVP